MFFNGPGSIQILAIHFTVGIHGMVQESQFVSAVISRPLIGIFVVLLYPKDIDPVLQGFLSIVKTDMSSS